MLIIFFTTFVLYNTHYIVTFDQTTIVKSFFFCVQISVMIMMMRRSKYPIMCIKEVF